jgi:hypothetical protein
LALILNVLGRIGRTNNIEVTFPDKEFDRWDAPMFILGSNWKTNRAFKNCNPYFLLQADSFLLIPRGESFHPHKEEEMGLLQKMVNPTNGLPVWVAAGWRGAGTTAAAYSLVRWWKWLGVIYGEKPFGLLVSFSDKDGWQQSHIAALYPTLKWHTIAKHPYAYYKLKNVMGRKFIS